VQHSEDFTLALPNQGSKANQDGKHAGNHMLLDQTEAPPHLPFHPHLAATPVLIHLLFNTLSIILQDLQIWTARLRILQKD
jgi:hypothetical protein